MRVWSISGSQDSRGASPGSFTTLSSLRQSRVPARGSPTRTRRTSTASRRLSLLDRRHGNIVEPVVDLVGSLALDEIVDLIKDLLERRMLDDIELLGRHRRRTVVLNLRRVHLP